MRILHGSCVGLAMVLIICACEAFHLQGLSSVRRSVCATALPCCPGHVCRAYQRFDASRPVAACATSLHARPIYAPGSPAQRRICGSTSSDIFSRRPSAIRTRSGDFGRRIMNPDMFSSSRRTSGFRGQLLGGQQWEGSSSQLRIADQGLSFPRRSGGQLTRFSDRSRIDPFSSSSSFRPQSTSSRFRVPATGLRSRGFRGQLNTLASVPQEQTQFVQSQSQFPQTDRTFSQGQVSFSQGQRSFPQGQVSFSQGRGGFTGRSQTFGRGDTFGQDLSFGQQQTLQGQGQFTDGQDIVSQLNQFPSDLSQGSAGQVGSQPLSDQSLGFRDILPPDGAPQPLLVEQPAVSVSPVSGPASGTADIVKTETSASQQQVALSSNNNVNNTPTNNNNVNTPITNNNVVSNNNNNAKI